MRYYHILFHNIIYGIHMDFGEDLAVEIVKELGKALEKLGGDMTILAFAGSFRDTLPDKEILDLLKDWNQKL